MTHEEFEELAAALRDVVTALVAYADAIDRDGFSADFEGSTYALDAQAAVHDLMQKDGV